MPKTKNIPTNKIGGTHTSLIPVAETIVDILVKNELVKKISPGIIKSYRGGGGARKHIKILNSDNEASFSITATDNSNNQKIRIYVKDSKDKEVVENLLIKKTKEKGITTS
jgi:hypothetical protein